MISRPRAVSRYFFPFFSLNLAFFQEPELRLRQYQADISQYMESQYPDQVLLFFLGNKDSIFQSTYQESDMSMNPETRAENIDQVEDDDENSGQGLEVNMEEVKNEKFC